MKVNKLSDFNKALFLRLSITFITIFFIAVIIFGFLFIQSYKNEINFHEKQLTSANQLFQSNLSEKISIIANSNTFIDYLRSGAISRQYMDIDFETELLPLKSQSVLKGMAIYSAEKGSIIYKTGKTSKYKVNLKLCYLNSHLSRYGECRYTWRLYLSKNNYIKQLKKTDDDISLCSRRSCINKNLLSDKKFGSFKTTGSNNLFLKFQESPSKVAETFFISLTILLLLLILFAAWIYRNFSKLISSSLIKPLDVLVKDLEKDIKTNITVFDIKEIRILSKQINKWRSKFLEYKKHEAQLAIGKLAAQVAHDIRSPVSALNAIIKNTTHIPEEQRVMMRNAAQRINDIANNLLNKHEVENKSRAAFDSQAISPELISIALDSVLSEKRAEYNDFPIGIDLDIESDSHGLFVKVDIASSKRIISNLINNAFEAIQNKGQIDVKLSKVEDSACITIVDNGVGMTHEAIQEILNNNNGISSKKTGHGIGIPSSHQLIDSWGGRFQISSKLGVGTTVTIVLPLQEPASWFSSRLVIENESTIVILDDDQSIHDVWRARFSDEMGRLKLDLIHFYTAEALLRYDASQNKRTYYLCDYELIGQEMTGLDVIEKLDVTSRSVTLVTSRYEDPAIRRRCERLAIQILPKNYAPYIPIVLPPKHSIKQSNEVDLILIDNDPLLTDTWRLVAASKKQKLVVFHSIKEAKKAIDHYKKSTSIYIDYDLGADMTGDMYAKELHRKGFQDLYLVTGYPSRYFDNMPWIIDVLGKEYPL